MQLFKKLTVVTLASIITVVASACLAPSPVVADERPFRSHDDSQDYQGSQSVREGEAQTRPLAPGNYGKYRKDFTELCAAIEADGRREFIHTTLLGISAEDPSCLDCESFFKIILPACKPKQSRPRAVRSASKDSSGEQPEVLPSPTPTPLPARLPGLRVHTKLTEIAVKLADDEARNVETLKVIEKIAAALRVREGRTHGEREYGEAFADFISTPFSSVRAKLSADQKRSNGDSAQDSVEEQRGTEGLFDL